MNIKNLVEALPFLTNNRITPWIWGLHAKGKSETIEHYYRNQGWMCFNFRLNTQADVGDFLGLQDFLLDPKTGEKVATKFCMPEWLKSAIDFVKANPDKRACIFLDEINRAARVDLIGPIFQMALDRKLHTYDFSDLNIDIIVASNPDTADYSILSLDDKALLSRFLHIHFSPTIDEWKEYARNSKYDSRLLNFYDEHPEFLEEKGLESFSISNYAKPDRRKQRWVNLLIGSNTGLSKDTTFELLMGSIGVEPTAALTKYLESQDIKAIEVDEILNQYKVVAKKIEHLKKVNRHDIIHAAVKKLEDYIKEGTEVTLPQKKNIAKLVYDVPADIAFLFIHNLLASHGEIFTINKASDAKLVQYLQSIKEYVKKPETTETEA